MNNSTLPPASLLDGKTELTNAHTFQFQIAVFGTLLVIFSVGLVALIRLPVGNGGLGTPEAIDYVRTVVYALVVVWLPITVSKFLPNGTWRSASIEVCVTFLAIVMVLFLPWWSSRILAVGHWRLLVDVLLVTAILVQILSLRSSEFEITKQESSFIVLVALLVSLAIMGSVQTSGYFVPWSYEFALLGQHHRDTVYHVALANMLEYHNVKSVGLDGLPLIGYHTLSHRVAGAFSNWAGLNTFVGYSLFFSGVALPLLFTFFANAAMFLRPWGWGHLKPFVGIASLMATLLVCSNFEFASYFASESYIFSLLMLMIVIPAMAVWSLDSAGFSEKFLLSAVFIIGITLASLAKISTGAVMFAGVAFLITASFKFRLSGFVLAFLVSLLPFVFIYTISSIGSGYESDFFSPFSFLIEHQRVAIFHIIITFIAFLYLGYFLPGEFSLKVLYGSMLIMSLAATASSLLLELEGGNAYYFANPGIWAAILLISSVGPASTNPNSLAIQHQLTLASMILLLVVVINPDRWKFAEKLSSGYTRIEQAARSYSPGSHADSLSALLSKNTVLGKIASEIDDIKSKKEDFAVFVAPEFRAYWQLARYCWAQPFYIPALTAIPLVKGLPPEVPECVGPSFFGLYAYDPAVSASATISDRELCDHAKTRNISEIQKFSQHGSKYIVCGR